MKTPIDIILALESTNSRLEKEDILRNAASMKNKDFFTGVRLAEQRLVTFGIKRIPVSTRSGPGLTMKKFLALTDKLISREISGNAAVDAVAASMKIATKDQWNLFYRRVLSKKMNTGILPTTINKIVKDIDKSLMIPVFACMLATDAAKMNIADLGKCFVEYKYDGIRAIVIVKDSVAKIFSRNGKLLENFPHINDALSHSAYNDLVFDAEIMSEDFQSLMKQVLRKTDVDTADAYLALFDVLDLKDFESGISLETQAERKDYLEQLKPDLDDCIRVVEFETVDLSTASGQKKYSKLNKIALDAGYEGLMLKPVDAPYTCKRTKAWLKIKPVIEVTLSIVDVEIGTGKYSKTTGAIVCAGKDAGKMINVKVGSGLSDEMRDDIWKNKNDVLGQLVEIQADVITQNQDKTYSLRFPRFKTFRGFAAGEKI